jgi:glycosyltransferase involved in cell wall biosynthesis
MQLQVPAKLYEYMGMGRPILALTDSAAIRDFVQRYTLGWVCDPGSADAIAQQLTRLLAQHHNGGLTYSGSVPDAYRADILVQELADFCNRSVDRRPHA